MTRARRVGLVGSGGAAGLFARALSELSIGDLVAVCGRSQGSVAEFTHAHAVEGFTSLESMIEQSAPDVVVVATPHPTHANLAIEAMRLGVDVLVEKPMATTVADCDRMIAVAESTNQLLGVVSQRRFVEPVQRMKAAIDGGLIGNPALASMTMLGWRDPSYFQSAEWRGTLEGEGGGVLVNQAVHHLDLLNWLFGPIDEVFGWATNVNHPEIEVEDTAVAVVRSRQGGVGTIVASNSQRPGLFARLDIHGANGASIGARIDGGQMFIAGQSPVLEVPRVDLWTVPGQEDLITEWRARDEALLVEGDLAVLYHRRQLEDFLRASRNGSEPLVTGNDGRNAVAIFDAIYRASRSGELQKTAVH